MGQQEEMILPSPFRSTFTSGTKSVVIEGSSEPDPNLLARIAELVFASHAEPAQEPTVPATKPNGAAHIWNPRTSQRDRAELDEAKAALNNGGGR